MSGYNHECAYCGKMSDDYIGTNCCEEDAKLSERCRLFSIAYDKVELDIRRELDDLLYKLDAEEVYIHGEKIISFIKELQELYVKK